MSEHPSGATRASARRTKRASRAPVVSLPLAAIPRATYRVQLHRDFTFADVTAARAVPRRTRDKPCVLLAVSQGETGEPARLRHRRPPGAQSRDRNARGLRAHGERVVAPWHEPSLRPRSQSHRDHGRRQYVVDGRAGERAGIGLRRVFRHRLDAAGPRSRRQGARPGARVLLWNGARTRRDRAALRARDGRLRHSLFRASLSARSANLSAGARRGARRRACGARTPRARRNSSASCTR